MSELKKYHILGEDDYFELGNIHPQDAGDVARFLWERTWIIDTYLKIAELPEEHKKIIERWKGCIVGEFNVDRHLKKVSIFISSDDSIVYMVNGIVSSWG